MDNKQYNLHSYIILLPTRKPGWSPAHPQSPTHSNIAVTNQQYHNNMHGYHLVKSMDSYLKKIVVTAITKQWIKGAKYMVMGYAYNSFVELMNWLCIIYVKIMPGYLMQNQDEMQATYNTEDPINILFNLIFENELNQVNRVSFLGLKIMVLFWFHIS